MIYCEQSLKACSPWVPCLNQTVVLLSLLLGLRVPLHPSNLALYEHRNNFVSALVVNERFCSPLMVWFGGKWSRTGGLHTARKEVVQRYQGMDMEEKILNCVISQAFGTSGFVYSEIIQCVEEASLQIP